MAAASIVKFNYAWNDDASLPFAHTNYDGDSATSGEDLEWLPFGTVIADYVPPKPDAEKYPILERLPTDVLAMVIQWSANSGEKALVVVSRVARCNRACSQSCKDVLEKRTPQAGLLHMLVCVIRRDMATANEQQRLLEQILAERDSEIKKAIDTANKAIADGAAMAQIHIASSLARQRIAEDEARNFKARYDKMLANDNESYNRGRHYAAGSTAGTGHPQGADAWRW